MAKLDTLTCFSLYLMKKNIRKHSKKDQHPFMKKP